MPRVYNTRTETYPRDAVYVGRPSKWGNPIRLDHEANRDAVLRQYEAWLQGQPALVAAMRRELRGRDLVCWCAPKACHADVILRIANGDGFDDPV